MRCIFHAAPVPVLLLKAYLIYCTTSGLRFLPALALSTTNASFVDVPIEKFVALDQ
jgi:hypothetical protein